MVDIVRRKNVMFYSTLMSNGARGADPCALSGTTTVETFESKKLGMNYFHDEGTTVTCPAMENRRQPHPHHTGKRG